MRTEGGDGVGGCHGWSQHIATHGGLGGRGLAGLLLADPQLAQVNPLETALVSTQVKALESSLGLHLLQSSCCSSCCW